MDSEHRSRADRPDQIAGRLPACPVASAHWSEIATRGSGGVVDGVIPGIPARDLPLVVDVVIGFLSIVVIVVRSCIVFAKIIIPAGSDAVCVSAPDLRQDSLQGRDYSCGWNDIPCEGRPGAIRSAGPRVVDRIRGAAIDDRRREIAGSFPRGRDCVESKAARTSDLPVFVAEKVKPFVLKNRVAERSAVHRPADSTRCARRPVRFGISPGITAIIEASAVPLVGSRLGRHCNRATGTMAGFGIHAVRGDDNFLYVVQIRDDGGLIALSLIHIYC